MGLSSYIQNLEINALIFVLYHYSNECDWIICLSHRINTTNGFNPSTPLMGYQSNIDSLFKKHNKLLLKSTLLFDPLTLWMFRPPIKITFPKIIFMRGHVQKANNKTKRVKIFKLILPEPCLHIPAWHLQPQCPLCSVDSDHGHTWSFYYWVCEDILQGAPGDVVACPGDNAGVPHLPGLLPQF